MYVINPKTKRRVKVGSAGHKKLIASGVLPSEKEMMPEVLPDEEDPETAETKRLVELSSAHAMKLFKKIKNKKMTIPKNINDDESLSNYLQQSLLLGLLDEKNSLLKKYAKPKKKPKKKQPESSDESSDSDSD
jgi:hypothetical protein